VAIARQGDTVNSVASRLGLSASELANYNGIPQNVTLQGGEVIALPKRISGTPTSTPAGTIATAEPINVTALANETLGPSSSSSITTTTLSQPASNTVATTQSTEPVRHQVKRGETVYSIARTYGISVRALSEWNGLGTDLSIQEGRYLLIPVKTSENLAEPLGATSTPGTGSATPTPPSAATALPEASEATPEPVTPSAPPPDLGATQSSSAQMAQPVSGPIIRDYDAAKSRFILFSAAEGSTVKAAKDGTVKLISTNADGVQIVVVDHGDGLQTAYSFIDNLSVKKGDSVSRGQPIAKVTNNEFGALQFMVFKGTQTVDPTAYLN
jgi:murein DD-endopeptidase MepM/ murein hydrolase activator NlpD